MDYDVNLYVRKRLSLEPIRSIKKTLINYDTHFDTNNYFIILFENKIIIEISFSGSMRVSNFYFFAFAYGKRFSRSTLKKFDPRCYDDHFDISDGEKFLYKI